MSRDLYEILAMRCPKNDGMLTENRYQSNPLTFLATNDDAYINMRQHQSNLAKHHAKSHPQFKSSRNHADKTLLQYAIF